MNSSISFKQLQFRSKRPDLISPVFLRRIIVEFDTEPMLRCWLDQGDGLFMQLELVEGHFIKIDVGKSNCPVCHQDRTTIEQGRCFSCVDSSSDFQVRLSCLFKEPQSPLSQHDGCRRDQLSCGIENNRKYCFSKYLLYFGKFGSRIKVGITRKSRRGGYKQRLLEQGLEEAIVVIDFPSLPEVLEAEQYLIDCGLDQRLEFDDKVKELQHQDSLELQSLYPMDLVAELFPDKDIIYEELFSSATYPSIHGIRPPERIEGKIVKIIGKLIIINSADNSHESNSSEYIVVDLAKYLHHELITYSIKEDGN